MTVEIQLTALLKTLCPNVYPDEAPVATPKPYVTYQGFGGPSLRNLDKTPADKCKHFIQINVWAVSRLGANALARQIEDAMCAATVFNAQEEGLPIWDRDPVQLPDAPDGLYSTIQDFVVIATR
ncbi:DUF3168 domain-containing protein [Roseateles cavernae]|uniref:DUF3168 domain-containing protein n=1 Tax=Roseateles cavernae TaxID=3153578 RepID=UPI0032E4BE41